MKKVLFMLTSMNLGGTEKSLLNLLDTYSPDENDVTILLLKKDGALINELPSWVKVLEIQDCERPSYELRNSPLIISFHYLKKIKLIRAFNILFRHIWFRFTKNRTSYYRYVFKDCHLKDEYDTAIVYEGPYDSITAYMLFCVNAKEKIQWIHFDVSQYLFHKETCRSLYPQFDVINVVSDKARESLLSIIPGIKDKTKTVKNVISPKRCKELAEIGQGYSDNFDGIRILTVGRLSEEKGQDIIPEIAYFLSKAGINFRWYIIGEGYLKSEIETNIRKYNNSNNVRLLGNQLNPYPFFKNADIYVQTSIHEGYGLVIAEAKVFDLAIVATECAATHEQLDNIECAAIVKRNTESIAKAIEDLITKCWNCNGDT